MNNNSVNCRKTCGIGTNYTIVRAQVATADSVTSGLHVTSQRIASPDMHVGSVEDSTVIAKQSFKNFIK